VPRAAIELYHLRPGQKLAGKLRLPRDREKGLVLDDVVTIEGEPAEKCSEPTDFEKLTPQFPQGRIMLENPKTNSICARELIVGASRARPTRVDRGAAARWQNDFAQKKSPKRPVNHPGIVLIPCWWTSDQKK
jgi:transcription termination factor Rho